MNIIDKDYALALQLQEQYNSSNQIIPKHVTPVKSKEVPSNLGSPSWELTDPTPNVHALFIQFNAAFFWGKLSSVVVRWSKRMYSCAGICRYQGRNGFCDIALSEPLLKLRPRKDLVETLLHEMIHAFLFLTNNDRDRDGHGPNFLQHMHRINKLANVNISIYHNFIDEVHLYQTHWWRCNGPCQTRKPFFGIVRRSSNRAPGPNDFWWQNHQLTCGGTFLKIKEPEKKNNMNTKSKIKTNVANDKTITDFFNSNKENNSNDYHSLNKSISKPEMRNIQTTLFPKIKTEPKHENIATDSESENIRETVRNHWLHKYDSSNKRPNDTKLESPKPSKVSRIESSHNTNDNKNTPYQFDVKPSTSSSHSIVKKEPSDSEDEKPVKYSLYYSLPENMIDGCNKILQDLYGKDFSLNSEHFKYCHHSDTKWSKASMIESNSIVQCPICNDFFSKSKIDEHLGKCLGEEESSSNDTFENHPKVIDLTTYDNFTKPKNIKSETLQDVIDLTDLDCSSSSVNNTSIKCSTSQIDSREESIKEEPSALSLQDNLSDDYYNCPICNKKLEKNQADEHLEQCVSSTFLEESDTSGRLEDESDSQHDTSDANESGVTKYPCPCCSFLINENEMNSHLDDCIV